MAEILVLQSSIGEAVSNTSCSWLFAPLLDLLYDKDEST